MLPTRTQSTPRRFLLVAAGLMLPALALGAFGFWALRLDRRAAEADQRYRAEDVARAIATRLTNVIQAPIPRDPRSEFLVIDSQDRLVWPKPGLWPPKPAPLPPTGERGLELNQRTPNDPNPQGSTHRPPRHLWHLARSVSETNAEAGVSIFNQVLFQVPPEAITEAGLNLRAGAVHAILDLAQDHLELIPPEWVSDPMSPVLPLLEIPSSPIAESAIDRYRQAAPKFISSYQRSNSLAWVDALIRPREVALQAYAALTGPPGARRPVKWNRFLHLEFDRQAWLAVRRESPFEVIGRSGLSASNLPTVIAQTYALHPWPRLMDQAREAARTIDPRGSFGMSIRITAADFELFQEEPSDTASRAVTWINTTLAPGVMLTVATAPVDHATYAAAQVSKERRLGAVLVGVIFLALAASIATWRLLASQHRLALQKSNFVASVSHELRAPLASVRLLADNLEHDRVSDPERRSETLRWIGRECRRLTALVENVLDLSRIDRGVKKLDPEPTDVPSLVRETCASAALTGIDNQVQLLIEIAASAENLVASVDAPALQQALSNLLDNALKHSPPDGAIRVALGVETVGRYFTLSVSDQGPGIPESERHRVFEPFHRLGNELRREHAGVGIGLAIVRHVAEAHHGRVWVEGVKPQGARLVLRLPVGLQNADPIQANLP
ncbi:MAG: HAMP domain-containing histidine kinase [Verrucomicrobiales bacterium]|nr:HAMP domain-containing histidine kinase [Verrucomicrobiales bacterium]